MNTDRVYRTTTELLVVCVFAVISWAFALYAPSITERSNEIVAAWMVTFMATALAIYVSYGWACGHKTVRQAYIARY